MIPALVLEFPVHALRCTTAAEFGMMGLNVMASLVRTWYGKHVLG